jgi:PAS domain S-box-containing protein
LEPRLYNRLLVRLIALPIAALAVLALILGYGLQRLQTSANSLDHSDLIVARANGLMKLMVDEETGVRGYLLARNPVFLQPMREADKWVDHDLRALMGMVGRRPEQVARLQSLQAEYTLWNKEALQEIASPPSAKDMEAHLLHRKESMDDLRRRMDEFLDVEVRLRNRRTVFYVELNRWSQIGLIVLVALAAALLAFETRRIFHRLTSAYWRQIRDLAKQHEETYEREQWLNTTLRSIGDAVIACDFEGRVEFMNMVAEDLTGWPQQEAKGRPLSNVFPIFNEETRAVVENPVDKVRRLGTVVGLANHTFLVSRDGREICIDDSGAPIRDSTGKMIGIVLVFRDITERRMSEGALMRAEKLAAAGRLAASVAHEVNNPLEGLTNLVYIARHSDDMNEIRQLLLQADEELGRIAHITRQSLGFYRETTAPTRFEPAVVVREVADFYAARAVSVGVSLVVRTSTQREVLGAAGEIRQILSNLLANSLDACSKGDTIRIDANSAIDPRDLSRIGVRITIGDSGLGIRQEHLESIFEPFFTTKKDTGTGLGLWVSKELVEKHGGSLRVRSNTLKPRCGTVFSIFLPVEGRVQEAGTVSMDQTASAENELSIN